MPARIARSPQSAPAIRRVYQIPEGTTVSPDSGRPSGATPEVCRQELPIASACGMASFVRQEHVAGTPSPRRPGSPECRPTGRPGTCPARREREVREERHGFLRDIEGFLRRRDAPSPLPRSVRRSGGMARPPGDSTSNLPRASVPRAFPEPSAFGPPVFSRGFHASVTFAVAASSSVDRRHIWERSSPFAMTGGRLPSRAPSTRPGSRCG
jgi:hypothetical protein